MPSIISKDPMNRPILQFLAAIAPSRNSGMLAVDVNDRTVLAYNKEPYAVWKFLQSALPVDCRCVLYGRCALAAPHGAILAVVIGDTYVLRVPDDVFEDARQSPKMRWHVDLKKQSGNIVPHEQFGKGWIWGISQHQEPRWCRMVYGEIEMIAVRESGRP